MSRLDQYLVSQGIASSRTKAKEMIDDGHIEVKRSGEILAAKASLLIVPETDHVTSTSNLEKYVSRGGFKLEKALDKIQLDVKDFFCLDIGVSTGGFTDCLLQNGARFVVGIDVGQAQTHPKILGSKSVIIFEKLHASQLYSNDLFLKQVPPNGFDMIVIDVSFISIQKILPEIKKYLSLEGVILGLFKPQFEVGQKFLNKNGIVKDFANSLAALEHFKTNLVSEGLFAEASFETGFPGRDGNKEFFVCIRYQR